MNQLAERYDAGLQDGKLLIQQCDSCGKAIMYPRWRCPFCYSESLSFVEAQGTGTLYSMTVQYLTAPTAFALSHSIAVGAERRNERNCGQTDGVVSRNKIAPVPQSQPA